MLPCKYRGRFAPSPTGALHAGSLATALGSWLDAKAHDGVWLLRIEDVDLPRTVEGAAQDILQQLAACGLHWDEEVIYQSNRSENYQHVLDQLIRENKTYPCICTRQQIEARWLELRRPRQRHEELLYPGTCKDARINPNQAVAWRLRVQDLVLQESVGDFVLKRADGCFTYQLAVVVDDQSQHITHVVRGADLEDNTARQIYLQQQLGYATPYYKHLPLVVNEANEKLSKQTKAPVIEVDSQEKILNALRLAANHLGLRDQKLYEGTLTNALWLELALSDYRLLRDAA